MREISHKDCNIPSGSLPARTQTCGSPAGRPLSPCPTACDIQTASRKADCPWEQSHSTPGY